MVLGKLPVPGRPIIWMIVGQEPIALAVGEGGGHLDIFTLLYPFSSLSPALWETARYRLKYCLKGPLNPKTTNQQPRINGQCRKRGLPSFRDYPLTPGFGFHDLHRRPCLIIFLTYDIKIFYLSFVISFMFDILRRITTFSERLCFSWWCENDVTSEI